MRDDCMGELGRQISTASKLSDARLPVQVSVQSPAGPEWLACGRTVFAACSLSPLSHLDASCCHACYFEVSAVLLSIGSVV